jgi:signal transduction histidine kinase
MPIAVLMRGGLSAGVDAVVARLIGGADRDGHGLVGIADRATALGGRLEIESPAGGGTLVEATLPLSAGR